MAIFLVDLEAVDTRYTGQWKAHVPSLLKEHGHEVYIISGPTDIPAATTPGAFLNFGGTNVYKAAQVESMARLFTQGKISAGDHFIFTDAWHPGIINLKYMSELLQIPVTIHALWHAGSYDPQDFLGRLIGDVPWVRNAEASFFYAIDHNYFATDFHIEMFCQNLFDSNVEDMINDHPNKIVRTGWPMEYMEGTLTPYKNMLKRDLILFPHRIAPEKQVEIFKDLEQRLPQYEFVVCQEQQLTKDQYHALLGEAKIVFSANLQETLGISMYEGSVVGAIPLVPDRLSYSEMYFNDFKYPSEWTVSWEQYINHRDDLCQHITDLMTDYDSITSKIEQQKEVLRDKFFSAGVLIEHIKWPRQLP
jgi:hypothetical protein